MSKKSVLLIVILVILGLSLVLVESHNSKERSDVSPLMPMVGYGQGGTGSIAISGEVQYNFTVSSRVNVEYSMGTTYYERIDLTIFPGSLPKAIIVQYSFNSGQNFVPLDAELLQDFNNSSVYLYTDPYTGDSLRFYLLDGELDHIEFEGRTIADVFNTRVFVDFDLKISYHFDKKFIKDQSVPLPKGSTYTFSGTEGDCVYSGLFSFIPESSYRMYGDGVAGNVSNWFRVDIDIEDSLLSKYLNGIVVTSDKVYLVHNSYLKSNVLTTIDIRFYTDQDGIFGCSGSISIEELDSSCKTVSSKTIFIEYKEESI